MSRIPLSVRLVTARSDRHVTRSLRDLTFRETAVGGWASAKLAFDRPLAVQPDEFDYYSRAYVYDRQSGRVVFEGMVEDPGRSTGADGETYALSIMGPATRAGDQRIPLVYVDRSLEPWLVGGAAASANYLRIDQRMDDDGTAIIQIQAPSGCTFKNGAAGLVVYNQIATGGQLLGRVSVNWRSGTTSASLEARLGTATGAGATNSVETDALGSTSGTLLGQKGTGNLIPSGDNTVRLRFARVTSDLAVTTDNVWLEFTNPVVRTLLKTATGSDITSGYSTDTILASQVVNDLLGRALPLYDGANASVATTSWAIEQLAYPGGITPSDVLDDLMGFEPAYRWGAYESNQATGLHRFEWTAWPTTVRYEADLKDGYYAPGSADGLYNVAIVRWQDAAGRIQVLRRTSTVAALTAAGLSRAEVVDLSDHTGTLANAQQAGDQFLSEHAAAPNAGTLTVMRPVIDLYSGRRVQPWEIKAGELIRVRGITPRVDSLNASARDGATVFRVFSKEYSTSQAAATLELDSYSPTTARALANLGKQNIRRSR